MNNKDSNLPELARLDAHLFDLHKQLAKIPVRLADKRKPLDQEELLLNEVLGPWESYEEEIAKRESTIQLAQDTIAKFEEHMKQVTTQEEFAAAKRQVDEARRLNNQLQEEILASRLKQEELAPQLEELRAHHGNVLAEFQEAEAKMLKERKALEKKTQAERKRFDSLGAQEDPRLMQIHERLTGGGKRPAIVPVVGGTCNGCYMTIPPQTYNQLIASPEHFGTCSHCNRIIIYDQPEAQASEDAPAA